jgi:acyl-coenzyme A synthetase/AMP-(fatty) acid ligase
MTPDAVDVLKRRFSESRNDVLLSAPDGYDYTYAQIYANACKLADDWKAAGVAKGDTVAFVLPNCAGYLAAYVACAVGGFVANPVVPELLPESIDYILELASPKLVVREAPQLDPSLDWPADRGFDFDAEPDKAYLNIFSSGTTGNPKGICHSLGGIIGNASSFARLSGMDAHTRLYHVLPMAYMAGFQNTQLCPLLAGGRIVLGPAFSPASAIDFWTRPMEQGVNFMILTPSIASALSRLARDPDIKSKIAGIEQIQTTAGQLTSGIRQQFLNTFGKPLQDCYGVTELGGPFTTQDAESALREENVGRVIPEMEISVLEDSASAGELWIRTPFVMLGYLSKDGLDPPVLSDGFMATGDVAEYADGKLTITGRTKDMIIKGGINVAPIAIENSISRLADVKDVAVIGVRHEFWGEIIVACVQLRSMDNANALKLEVQNHCASQLATIHRPDHIAMFAEFPRAMNGKIQKHVLRDEMAAKLSENRTGTGK